MCTAFSCVAGDHHFARNLDLDYRYKETVTIMPRNYPIHLRHLPPIEHHYAMMGIATVLEHFPLYYDGFNEKGLCIAGLNFPGNACYSPFDPNKMNIATFELIPWLLAECETVAEAVANIQRINICDTAFRGDLMPTPLHWIISDQNRSVTVEPLPQGVMITENPVRVLTNNPIFSYHLDNLSNYMNLTPRQPDNRFSSKLRLSPYSLGLGAFGLPGDFSSASRFVRCAYVKENALFPDTEEGRVNQVFHILQSVAQYNGCVQAQHGFEKTVYSICCNANKGILYYITYDNRQITAIDLYRTDLEADQLAVYPLLEQQQIYWQN